MSWRLGYTPYIWLAAVSTMFPLALAVHGWRRRSVPGALPFTALMACGVFWALGSALERASTDLAAKIFWAKVQSAWQPPLVTAGLWFALEYADLRGWLARRHLILLATPPVLWLLLILTNDTHRLVWSGFSFQGSVHPERNTTAWIFIGYVFLLGLATILVFTWLFWRSPLHRVPVALCLCGQIVARAAYGLKTAGALPALPVDPVVLSFDFCAVMFAGALFRFRLFNLIPIARGTVIDQMREGMLVLDGEGRVMDLNPAAERILEVSAAHARGAGITDLLPSGSLEEDSEIELRTGEATRHYAVHHSALTDRRGLPVGAVILLDDVTEQKQSQAQLLEQHRALATLRERDRVARELHDTLGQVLGYIKMQAEVAQTFLERDAPLEVKRRLARMAAAVQDAQSDVREYILAARTGRSVTGNFLPTLETYLQRFREIYSIAATLDVSPNVTDGAFEPMVETQLLRIIQEALTNVRKHAQAATVDIRITANDGHAESVIQDDGTGFDPALVEKDSGQRYGLRLMRERAKEVGGALQVHSAPGAGTRVIVSVPLRSVASGGRC